jgi:hypothetical protein
VLAAIYTSSRGDRLRDDRASECPQHLCGPILARLLPRHTGINTSPSDHEASWTDTLPASPWKWPGFRPGAIEPGGRNRSNGIKSHNRAGRPIAVQQERSESDAPSPICAGRFQRLRANAPIKSTKGDSSVRLDFALDHRSMLQILFMRGIMANRQVEKQKASLPGLNHAAE